MKKSLIALAVAGAFAAPAFAATSNVDVYGHVHVAVEDTNVKDKDIQVTDHQSRIGFKGAEDLGGGLKAIWQIEQAISTTPASQDGIGGASLANRNTFVGLSGGFGTVLMGRHDTPYKLSTGSLDVFADTAADWNLGGVGITRAALKQSLIDDGELAADAEALVAKYADKGIAYGYINATHDHRSPSAIAYVSPNFSGLSFAAAVVATNATANLNNNKSMDAYSLSATYSNGPLFLAAGYQDVDLLDSQAWKIGAGYTMGDLKVGVVYEHNDIGVLDADGKTWGLNAAYSMGPMTFKAQFMDSELESFDARSWAIGLDYAMSKRTTAYVMYSSDKADRLDYVSGSYVMNDTSINTWAVGLKHSF